MKKLILSIVYLVLLVVFTYDLLAQRDYTSVQTDTATAVSAAFNVNDGWYLTGIKTPDLATGNDTIFFLVSIDGLAANFDTLYDYDNTIIYVPIDTVSHYVGFDFKKLFQWEWWKVVTLQNVEDDKTWQPYFNKMNN